MISVARSASGLTGLLFGLEATRLGLLGLGAELVGAAALDLRLLRQLTAFGVNAAGVGVARLGVE